jgi:hypothetical protein
MSFAEAGQRKQLLAVRCEGREFVVEPIVVPSFQELVSLRGDLPELLQGVAHLKAAASAAWVELQYEGEAVIPTLREQLLAAAEGSDLIVLRIRNSRIYDYVLQQAGRPNPWTISVSPRSLSAVWRTTGSRQTSGLLHQAFREITAALDPRTARRRTGMRILPSACAISIR